MPRKKSPRTQRLDWIDLNNQRQVTWAINYLVSRHLVPEGNYVHQDAPWLLDNLRRQWPPIGISAPQIDQIETRMRGAWRSRRHDDRHRDEKVYGFRMSKEVGSKLEQLTSRGVTVGQAVEDLIRGGLEQAKRIKELQTENRALRYPLSRKDAFDPLRSRNTINQLKEKNRALSATAKEWQSACESLAQELARHKVALRAQGALEAGQGLRLPPEDEVKAQRLQRLWMKAYESRAKNAVKVEPSKVDLEAGEPPLASATQFEGDAESVASSNVTDVATSDHGRSSAEVAIAATPTLPATDATGIPGEASTATSSSNPTPQGLLPVMPWMHK